MTNPRLMMFFIAALLMTAISANAQVTIGHDSDPARAAILELKTQNAGADNVTSTKGGLLLPRVKLTNVNTMEPLIATSDPDWNNATKLIHTGLMVYNLSTSNGFNQGTYTWNGSKWEENRPTAVAITAGNGLTKNGDDIQLGGSLTKATTISQGNNTLSVTGTGSLTVSAPLKVEGSIKMATGAGKDKVLTSDADGNASWGTIAALPSSPKGVLGSGITQLLLQNSNYTSTGSYIILKPGKWFVQVVMVADLSATTENFWIRSTFIRDGQSAAESQYFEGTNLVSGRASGGYNIISGYVIMKNETASDIKFNYSIGNCARNPEGSSGSTSPTIGAYGASGNVNSIVAFPMI